jgi:eukaryotic-like serine/threonine-protein kinase
LPGTRDELEKAADLAERAVAAGRKGREFSYPYAVFAKGLAAYRLGRFDEAIALMSGEAARAESMGPAPRLVTAMAQHQTGQRDKALKTLATAVVSHDWSASKADSRDPWMIHVLRREAEALILPNLTAFLEGSHQPRGNDERLALLGACEFWDRRTALASLYAAAFAADPNLAEDVRAGHRYQAACAAVVAGRGGGADGAGLSEAERARWRKQAREWLRLDLAAWTKRLETNGPTDRAELQKTLMRWPVNPDLAGLREPKSLDQMSLAEREDCLALWGEFDSLIQRAHLIK